MKLFPSLISSNLLELGQTIATLDPYVDGYHLDVMDFHYVPNLTWGPCFINAIRRATKKQLWIHLMVDEAERYLERFELAPNDIVSFHEQPSLHATLKLYQELNKRNLIPGFALKPTIPVTAIELLLHYHVNIRHVLLMSVEPGFSGQTFLPPSLDRLHELVRLRSELDAHFSIGIDGGITQENIGTVSAAGAQDIAVASAIFSQPDPLQAIKLLRQKAEAL